MTDYATPDEARTAALGVLSGLFGTVTTWDAATLDQVVLHLDRINGPISMNLIRALVPEDACRRAGLYFGALLGHDSLRKDAPRYLDVIGEEPSLNPKAHGKPVKIYRLTDAGRKFIKDRVATRVEARRTARAEQRKAAA